MGHGRTRTGKRQMYLAAHQAYHAGRGTLIRHAHDVDARHCLE